MLDKFIYGLGVIYLVVIGILATIAMLYYISNYIFQRMNANAIFFDFVKNRKEFKEWQKNKGKIDFKTIAKLLEMDADMKTQEFLKEYHARKSNKKENS